MEICTIGAKVSLQNLLYILTPLARKFRFRYFRPRNGEKIVDRNFTRHWCRVPNCRSSTLQTAECHTGISDHMRKIRECLPGESIFLWNLAPMVPKVSLQNMLYIWTALCPKIPIRYFQPQNGEKSWRETLRTNGAELRSAIVALCTHSAECRVPHRHLRPDG